MPEKKKTTAEKAARKSTKKTAKTTASKRTKSARAAKAVKSAPVVAKQSKAVPTARKKAPAKGTVAKPAMKKESAPKGTGKLRVRQVRSGIGHSFTMKRTLAALGLKHHQDEVVLPDNQSVRGMLRRVHHLVAVTNTEQ